MQEIVNGILAWTCFSETKGYDFNGHIIRDPGGNLCIDPVDPSDPLLEEIAGEGVARILLTNRNHCRAANRIRERTGARIGIHSSDAGPARGQGTEIDDSLHAGESIGPLRVVAVPGKSPGEVAFHWPERRILIVGDVVIGNPAGQCGVLPERVMDEPPRLRDSVRALLELDFDTLLVGDGVSILEGAKDRLRALVDSFPG